MILQIDASALRNAGCARHFYLTLQGYREKWLFNDIEYGSAVHVYLEARALGELHDAAKVKGMEYYCKKMMDPKFVSKPNKKHLTPLHLNVVLDKLSREMTEGILDVVGVVPLLDRDSKRIVEATFALPLLIFEDIECLLVGTIDLLGIGKGTKNLCVINDYKTTSFTDKRGYMESYLLAAQLRVYQLAIKLWTAWKPDSYWAEIWNNYRFGGAITGIFLDALNCTTERSSIMFLDCDDLIQFEMTLRQKVTELCQWIKLCEKGEMKLPPREGIVTNSCEKKFAGCLFSGVCINNDETAWQMLNAGGFEIGKYEPMTFRK